MSQIFISAFLTGVIISLIIGPLGCLVIWNRLVYLGDAIAHASLLGIIISIIININIFLGGAFITILVLILFLNYHSEKYPIDTVLAIFSYTALSWALTIYSLSNSIYINLESVLFGDILATTYKDLIIISIFAFFSLTWLKIRWNDLVFMTINVELAKTRGINAQKLRHQLIILVALLVILAIKIIGVILITSLLIIPAASSRAISSSPEKMAITSSVISIFSVMLGLTLSYLIDIPSGPSIIIVSSLFFFITSLKTIFP